MAKNPDPFSLTLLVALLANALSAPAQPLPKGASQAEGKLDAAWWARTEPFLRRVLNVPRSVKLEFKQTGRAGTGEFRPVTLEVRQGEQVKPFLFYASADGTKILVDQLYDLTQDPFAGNRARIRLAGVPSQGPASALATIVVYSDYTCPFCEQFFHTLEKPTLERYAGRVRYIYKHFPVRPGALEAAVAAACAFRQSSEAFWGLHQRLFQNRLRLTEKGILIQLARGLPVDGQKFESCLERRESLPDVQGDVAEAKSLGVEGTPTLFINGRPKVGLPTRERFWEIVDEELALANSTDKK